MALILVLVSCTHAVDKLSMEMQPCVVWVCSLCCWHECMEWGKEVKELKLGSYPRLLSHWVLSWLPLLIPVHIRTFFCGPQITTWARNSKHVVQLQTQELVRWIYVMSILAAGEAEQVTCIQVAALSQWKCLFWSLQFVCLFLWSVWGLSLLSYWSLLKWLLWAADS